VLFITTSLEEGLLLKPNPLVRIILESSLAKAQALYRVRICHFLFEENHVHMILVVDNPEDIPGFIGRFKTESAHSLNRLLGRRKRTVWCEGYDSPILASPVDVIREIVYLYTNPSKDDLVDSIEDYPNLSTWTNYKAREHKISCIPYARRDIYKLQSLAPSEQEILSHVHRLEEEYPDRIELDLSPDAWMEIMEVPVKDRDKINERIIGMVHRADQRYTKKREKEEKSAIGKERLLSFPFSLNYRSKRSGRKSYCISRSISLRVHIIQTIKALINEGREVLERWRAGDHTLRYPIGIYPPSMPRMGNLIPGVVV
jgi:REP element-mobilizing transposase RayT